MVASNFDNSIQQALSGYDNLSTDEKLAFLWYVYLEMGKSVTPAAPGVAADEIAEGLYNQVKELSHQEQLQAQRNIIEKKDEQIVREYGALSENTKLFFWYRLAQGMDEGTIIPMPNDYQMTGPTQQLLSSIKNMEFEQQITVLREAVAAGGAEPKSGSQV